MKISKFRLAPTIVLTMMMAFMLSSCVYEWPNEALTRMVSINITHDTSWSLNNFDTRSRTESGDYTPQTYRYIINVYYMGKTGSAEITKVLYRTESERTDFTTELEVPIGTYDIRVWSDCTSADDPTADLYYNTSDMSAITCTSPYVGATTEREAFRGTCTIEVPASIDETLPIDANITLVRPQAAYAFVSTDLSDFIETEMARRSSHASAPQTSSSSSSSSSSDVDVIRPDIDDFDGYYVRITYPLYLPTVYNYFTDKPIDSETGISYKSPITIIDDANALICFDQMFINGTESGVRVALDFFDPDGYQFASVSAMDVPLLRGQCTVVRGEFLTSKASGSTSVNPSFAGEFNIEIN